MLLLVCACMTEYSISDALETGELACDEGETVCFGECVNLEFDDANCGVCGLDCDDNELCEAGQCVSACSPACDPTTEWCDEDACVCRPPFETCDGQCVDTNSDFNYCGDCLTACAPGQFCYAGECLEECFELSACGEDCVDVSTHRQHCGDCDHACGEEQMCFEGECIDTVEPELECQECPCVNGCTLSPFVECCYDEFADAPACVPEGAC